MTEPLPIPAYPFLQLAAVAAAGLVVVYLVTHPHHAEYADSQESTKKAKKELDEAAKKALADALASLKKKKKIFGNPKPPPDPEPKPPDIVDPFGPTCTTDCPDGKKRRYTVAVHAQGTDCGGETKSTIGAPAVTKPIPLTVAEGLALSQATQAMLNRTQLNIREQVIAQAHKYIKTGPAGGGRFGKKSFPVLGIRGGIRYDVDCHGDGPSFVA